MMSCSHQPYITCAACGSTAPPPRSDGPSLRRIEYVHERRYNPSPATEKAVEALFETVRTLAALMEQHAKLTGHEGTARRIREVIADELTWESDKEVVDAFGEPA